MRAGPLSSPAVLETLAREHVNSWALASDLPRFMRATTDPDIRRRLLELRRHYVHPAISFILDPDGLILASLAANDIESDQDYIDFLESAGAEVAQDVEPGRPAAAPATR